MIFNFLKSAMCYPFVITLAIFYMQLTYHILFLNANKNNYVTHFKPLHQYSRMSLRNVNKYCVVTTPSVNVLKSLQTNGILYFDAPFNQPSLSTFFNAPIQNQRTKRKKPRGWRGGRNRRRKMVTVIDVFDRSARADTCRGIEPTDRDPEFPEPPAESIAPLPHARSVTYDATRKFHINWKSCFTMFSP